MLSNLIFSHKILIFIFIGLIISIPALTFLIKQRTSFDSDASTNNYDRTITQESSSSAQEVPGSLPFDSPLNPSPTSKASSPLDPDSEEGSVPQLTFGPTMNFKISIEGRPAANQKTAIFVGIAQGEPNSIPSYLLSFTFDVPESGIYTGLSLAGLTIGDTYTAYLKSSAQIATSSAFIVKSNITELNDGLPTNLTTGDLNEDNVINTRDYAIALAAYGTTPQSVNWNDNIDFNKDSIINLWDLAYIRKNLNEVGAGEAYTSKVASGSANIAAPSQGTSGGYWLFVPKF